MKNCAFPPKEPQAINYRPLLYELIRGVAGNASCRNGLRRSPRPLAVGPDRRRARHHNSSEAVPHCEPSGSSFPRWDLASPCSSRRSPPTTVPVRLSRRGQWPELGMDGHSRDPGGHRRPLHGTLGIAGVLADGHSVSMAVLVWVLASATRSTCPCGFRPSLECPVRFRRTCRLEVSPVKVSSLGYSYGRGKVAPF
jgi:hypothetical protein